MSHLAQRRDIEDKRLLIDLAKRVETLDNLKKLYLLTFADMRAVGPKIWNSWHDMLLGQLYQHTFEVFEREAFVEEDKAEHLERVQQRIAAATAHIEPTVRTAFLAEMPDRYFLGTEESTVAHHMDLVRRLAEGEPYFAEVRHFPERAFSEFTVLTQDRPGLFAMLTGVLLVHGMNILTASINTSSKGMALDIFRISHGDSAEVAQRPERWERLIVSVGKVLTGEATVEELVANAKPSGLLPKRYVPRVPTRVEVDNDVSDNFTVLDVYTQDRVGVLFAITNTLFRLGLSIHIAKITTNVDQVLDVFYVTDPAGQKIEDAAEIETIRSRLLQQLGPDAQPQGAPEVAQSVA
jgi:[protein-PII] uridylyltransferase